MLRPATPLSILFFAAFSLFLLSVLSTPIIKAIPLATFQGVDFGVLGYCQGSKCSGIRIGYSTDNLFSNADNSDFTLPLPNSARHSLSSILIVHPVAAFLSLVCLGLAIAAHFHAPAHSPRYLLALLLLTFPTLLVSLLAFLVDVLLFSPHMKWGSWIVLAATIIITACCVVTCAMRRTLVSRKARKKRIAENAEMNGTTFYNNQQQTVDELPKADSPPPLSSGNSFSPGDKMPEFATFELQQKKSDDRTPLNQSDPSIRSASTAPNPPGAFPDDETSRYAASGRTGPSPGPGGRGRPPLVDQYGNTLPPSVPNGLYGPVPSLRNQGSNNTIGSNRSGGPPPFYGRGRGGYPPRGGGYAPRGGPYGRGAGPPQGFRGPPPPGWNGRGGPMMGRGQRGPPPQPGYGYAYDDRQNFYGGPLQLQQGRDPSPGPLGPPGPYGGIPRNMSPPQQTGSPMPGPPPIAEASEMDNRGGLAQEGGTHYGLRDSDADVQGMIGLQQQRLPDSIDRRDSNPQDPNPISPSSNYGEDAYVPVRTNWNGQQPRQPLPLGQQYNNSSGSLHNANSASRGLSPIQDSPVQLPAQLAHTPSNAGSHKRTPSSDYYEDVDPRFAEQHPDNTPDIPTTTVQIANEPPLPTAGLPSSTVIPSSLTPAGVFPPRTRPTPPPPSIPPHLLGDLNAPVDPNSYNNSYEDLADGARSPAASEASHFTSVSQRGINPQWRPPPQPNPAYNGAGYGSIRRPRQEDALLEQNPDFALPGVGPGRGAIRGGARGGRGGMRGGMREPGMIGMGGMGGMGRYPGPDAI